ncbi:MAG: imidazoleglycerol-phosphate dehydratase [Sulfurovum sp. AS07-7]|nr:MAG: imidazoleglycerol-phosphate dehydratase [Sulfurovum sp. AS07-7]
MTTVTRKTKETDICVTLELYGSGIIHIDTGVTFLDHMLEAFAKHSYMDLSVVCEGDTHIDDHHSVEDVAIVIAKALANEIYPVKNIERFGSGIVVMDEASVSCDIDLSNRAYLVFDMELEGKIGSFDTELVEEFFKAFAFNLPLTLHLSKIRGKNKHHIVEASFKALALALRKAVIPNPRAGIPSTKGIL